MRRPSAGNPSASDGSRPPTTAPVASAAASADQPREMPRRTSASGSAARTESTYHASSGPLCSARAIPPRAMTTPNCTTSVATAMPSSDGDVQDPGQDERAPPAQDVGKAARGQLEHDDDEGVDGEQCADDRELDATGPQLEHEDRGHQADRQPLEAAEHDVAPFGLSCIERRLPGRRHRSRSSSRSNGKSWR